MTVPISVVEQACYTIVRYLVWIVMPLGFDNSNTFIADLTLVSLLSTTFFTSIVSGPIFYREISSEDSVKKIPFDAVVVLAAIAFSSFSSGIYIFIKGLDYLFFFESVLFCTGLSLFEWMRRKFILVRIKVKALRAYFFYFIILTFGLLAGIITGDISVYILIIGCGGTILFLIFKENTLFRKGIYFFESVKISSLYLFSGIFAYLAGNGLFWRYSSSVLKDFIVVRSFFTPVMIAALYIDVYGPELISLGKSKVFVNYILIIALSSAGILGVLLTLPHLGVEILQGESSYMVYVLAALTVAIISAIKYPVVQLRLSGNEMFQTVGYGIITLVVFAIPNNWYQALRFSGLEVLLFNYLMLVLTLIFYARKQKNSSFHK